MATKQPGFVSVVLVTATWLAACSDGAQGQATTGAPGAPLISLEAESNPTTTTATVPNPCEIYIDFGDVPVGENAIAAIELADVGSGPLSLGASQPTSGSEFLLTYDTQVIPPGGHIEIISTFHPSSPVQGTATFTIQTDGYNAACPSANKAHSIITIQLTGTGFGIMAVQPSVLDFGNALVNTTVTKSVTLINTSGVLESGLAAVVVGTDANLFSIGTVEPSLAAGGSEQIEIAYAPLSLEPRSIAFIDFTGSLGESATLNLFGSPVGVALTLTPNPIGFGFIARTATAIGCTRVTNQSNVSERIKGLSAFEGAAVFALSPVDDSTPPVPAPIPVNMNVGDSAKVCFSFTPPVAQMYEGQVTLETDDPSGINPVVILNGAGGGPILDCSPLELDFSGTGGEAPATLSVQCINTGTAIPTTNLTIGPLIASPSAFSAQFDPDEPYPDGGLAPDQSTRIDVTFQPDLETPDGGEGGAVGTLTIPNNAGPDKAPVVIRLKG